MDKCEFTCKVSSTINKDVKSFGKQFMFDNNDTTCWNSDEGKIQWILLSFHKPRTFSVIHLQFQGGFAAEQCTVEIWNNNKLEASEIIACRNDNSYQTVELSKCYAIGVVKFIFNQCSDTYGRIVIYHLKLDTK